MMRTSFRYLGTLVVLSSITVPVCAAESPSAPLPVLTMRTGEHKDFDRVVFDAPKGMTYRVEQGDRKVVVQFSLPAKIALGSPKLVRATGFQIVRGADGKEPLAVQFTIAAKATTKDFMSGPSVVVDVMGGNAVVAEKPASQPEQAKPVAAPTQKEESGQLVISEAKDLRQISPTPLPPESKNVPKEEAIKPAPVPSAPIAAVAPTPAAQPAQQLPNTLPNVPPAAAVTPPATPVSTIAPTPWPAPVQPVHTTNASPPPDPRPFVTPKITMDPKVITQIRTILTEPNPEPVAVFDPKIPLGAAIFSRGGYVTILFDRKLGGDALITSPPPRVKLEPLELPYNTGFRIAVPDGVAARATRRDTAWEIFLVKTGGEAALSTEFIAQPEFALGGRLLVSTGSPPTPFFYPDPIVGDDLIVLPLRENGAFTIKRRLADFQVIPAAQGLVIKPHHERVVARIVPDGIEITAEGGLKLSPTNDTGAVALSETDIRSQTKEIYAFERWRGASGDTFTSSRQKFLQTVVDVKEEDRVLARLDLARFYFSHSMGQETLAILSVIEKKLPEIVNHPDFLAIRAGARILTGRFQEGLADYAHPSLRDQPEVVLWKAVASAGMRDWISAFEQFSLVYQVLVSYPEPFRSRFSVLAIESAAAEGKDQKAVEWLTQLEKGGYPSSAESAIKYLRGVAYSKAGRADMAEKMWRQVTRGNDRLYKIRAELALVDLGVATKSLTPKQAVDRLEGLRFAWRGDDLEIDILKRLGGFYMDAKNFRMGFHVLSQILRLYPSAPQIPALRDEMVSIFKNVFTTDMGAALSPIDALTLFTDYKNFIPAGEEGNAVRRNLAERLIDIDLLDQACKLLEDLLKNSPTVEERVKTATRLAAVRLLDHKADAAIVYLDQSQSEASALPQAIQDERQLLRVRALSELGKYNDAVAAMPANTGKATKLLRADIALRAKNWGDASKALMDVIGPPEPEKPMDEEKATWLVQAAMSMARGADLTGLDRLAIDYGTAMDKTSKSNIFRILTRPEKVSQMKDIQAAQGKLSEVDMFRSVLDGYRTSDKK